ncbi:UDP-2,3-diacylglucosamine diphosphatase [Algicola sagamiensis]|uniref:UDP-2,3-diacylglucosamine diphosphatase n=1 Tax=Algicola sagamiensis TaxID=163869 RepID=UPI00037233D1|nr:UDP-2,3-diacylglucosamine diphosphatase [Algicola sagamiensis]
MQKTLFISDLHLCESRPDITALFVEFIQTTAVDCDALYILGDFFEVWVGDDDDSSLHKEVAITLRQLSDGGVPVFFIHGNRDFLLGKSYATQSGMKLLPEESIIDLYGERVLIMHGDSLCTQDLAYQKFRKKSRSWWWPRLMLLLPLSYRQKLGKSARDKSKLAQMDLAQMNMDLDILDVTPEAVIEVMEKHQVKTLIHGHTHRPDQHDIQLAHSTGKRIVLGDWYTQGSYLIVTPDTRELIFRPLPKLGAE